MEYQTKDDAAEHHAVDRFVDEASASEHFPEQHRIYNAVGIQKTDNTEDAQDSGCLDGLGQEDSDSENSDGGVRISPSELAVAPGE